MNKTAIAILIMIVLALSAYGQSSTSTTDPLESQYAISTYLVNQDPDPAVAGGTADVRIGMMNVGGLDVSNLSLELVQSYPFTILSGDNSVQQAGNILGYQGFFNAQDSKIIKFQVLVDRAATAGTYNLKAKVYKDGTDLISQGSFPIDVKNSQSAEVIHIDKTILVPGQETNLKFQINNVGNAPLNDLTFNWENTDNIVLPVGSDNTRYIKSIDVGGSAELDYNVIADTNAQPGLYQLNLYLTYQNSLNNSQKQISSIAGIYVGGGTDFDVAFSQSVSGQMSFTVANIGSNPATSVSVMVPTQPGWRVTGSNAMIIGNLNKGDYTVASFTMQSAAAGSFNRTAVGQGAAPGADQGQRPNITASQNNLKIQIAYTDTTGARIIVDKQVTLSPQNLGNATSAGGAAFGGRRTAAQPNFFVQYMWYLIGAIVLVIGYIVYRRYSKRKLADPDFKMKDMLKKRK